MVMVMVPIRNNRVSRRSSVGRAHRHKSHYQAEACADPPEPTYKIEHDFSSTFPWALEV